MLPSFHILFILRNECSFLMRLFISNIRLKGECFSDSYTRLDEYITSFIVAKFAGNVGKFTYILVVCQRMAPFNEVAIWTKGKSVK